MTTTTITDREMRACGNGPECLHPVCPDCDDILRSHNVRIADHPGTTVQRRGGQCDRCFKAAPRLTAEDLADQSHILLPDGELDRIRNVNPAAYAWHVERRRRLEANKVREKNMELAASTVQCKPGSGCFHPVCACGITIRSSRQWPSDHPRTRQGIVSRSICMNCHIQTRHDEATQ